MSRTPSRLTRCWTTVVLLVAIAMLAAAQRGLAQAPPRMTTADRLASLMGWPPTPEAPAAAQGPMARLVRNPHAAAGQAPYALADQTGAIQRYVEPVPGIDLEPYVGSVVKVRYDTGQTLLASQLDLPGMPAVVRGSPDPARVVGDLRSQPWQGRETLPQPGPASGVRLAQHVEPLADDDELLEDELLDDDATLEDSLDSADQQQRRTISAASGGVEPIYLDSMSPSMMGMPGAAMPAGMAPGLGPCPSCGGGCNLPGCGSMLGDAANCASCAQDDPWRLYVDLDVYIPRVRIAENVIGFGKLSEHYDLAPRVIVGFENPYLDGRVRYWRYHETTPFLSGGSVRFEFDVLDVEATTRFQGRRSDVTLAGGLRLADVDVNYSQGIGLGNDMIGLTLAADAQTRVFSGRLGQWGLVYGGRLSMLGGDWGSNFVLASARDDTVTVQELYGGVEYLYSFRNFDVNARVTAEWQNWHSDALSQIPGSPLFQSIGFFGPCAQFGVNF